ncbi:34065_t:CDS:2 [Racocetra persica]|uniref:34065_t:CDS:1 n=1 Tax=Racocetra persica TaxID=160502 RepID=A0ACA9RCV2_9GLOM|nr:34065_t:CDS:2 [Racocetra persica]
MDIGYKSIVGLRAMKVLNTNMENISDTIRKEIEKNFNTMKSKLSEPKDNMKCDLPESIASSCKKFVDDFNKPEDIHVLRNVVYNKS